jgi:amidase/aspartyl-tRNA(Asn)/glutamyl-tRNA(Gln) amidotransferase subunit A
VLVDSSRAATQVATRAAASVDPAAHPGSTVAAMARALGRDEVSPTELVAAALDRIDAVEHGPGAVNAFAHLRAEAALDEARAATERRARGRARGPLDGVPVAAKDLGDRVPGLPATLGCRAVEPSVPAAPSVLVSRLQAAGCIVVGSTNVPQLGHRLTTDNDLHGPTSTPFAPGRGNAGGSSGGSAAAVATGMVTAALGTDGAGSIRVPAAMCGVVGLKPGFGVVPTPARPHAFRNGALAVSAGPLTRTVEDTRLLLDVLAGPDTTDPFSAPSAAGASAGAARPAPARLRVGMAPDLGRFPVEPDVAGAVMAAGEALAAAGHAVGECTPDWPAPADELCRLVRRAVGWTMTDAVEGLVTQGLVRGAAIDAFAPSLLELVDEARSTTTDGWRADGVLRTGVLDELERLLAVHDVVLGPVACVAGVENQPGGATLGPSSVAGTAVDPTFGWSATWLCNLTGHPAASVPVDRTPDGLPLAVQIIGRRHADHVVLAAAAALERQRPWHHWYAEVGP